MAEAELGPPLESNPFSTAPSLGPPVDNPWAPTGARAVTNVATAGNPDQAATAINLSQKTGTPASIIQLNPDQHQKTYDIQQGTAATETNPAIAKFVQKPVNAAVASGITGEMDEVSKHYQELAQDRLNNKPYDDFFKGMLAVTPHGYLAETGEAAMSAIRNLEALTRRGELGVLGGMATTARAALAIPELAFSPLTGAVRSFGGRTLQAVDELLRSGAVQIYGEKKVPAVPSFEREAGEAERLSMVAPVVGFAPRIKAAEGVATGYKSFNDFMHMVAGFDTRAEINEFLKRAAGGDKAEPLLQIEKAQGASEALDTAVEASKDNPLRQRSVAAYEEFLEAHEDVKGNVHIPGQALADLYKDGTPTPGDKLLGFGVSPAEYAEAARTGSEVAIPLAKYVANMADRPEVHAQLKDVLRVHEDGTSLERAEEIKQEAQAEEKRQAAVEPVPEDHVRFYHGGEDPTSGGGRWVTPDPVYARDFRNVGVPNEVHYVDIPKGDPAEVAARNWDEIDEVAGTNAVGTYGHVEVPEHWAKQLKPLPPEALPPLEPPYLSVPEPVGEAQQKLDESWERQIATNQLLQEAKEENLRRYARGEPQVSKPPSQSDVTERMEKNRAEAPPKLSAEERIAVRAANAANRGLFLKPFFEEAKALGISEANFDRFSKQLDKAKELELTRAVAVAQREISRLMTPAFKRDQAAMRVKVEAELQASPAFLADKFFNTDKGMLPNGTRIPKETVTLMRAKPDEWASYFGFDSGQALIDALRELEQERASAGKGPKWQWEQRVKAETARRMEEQYGNLKDNIEIAASEIALENHNVDLLTTQLRMLAEANGLRPPIGREGLEAMVRNEFATLPTGKVSLEKWRRAAERAGVRIQTAFLKKDIVEAFNGVQQQRLALVFMREAKAFAKEMDQFNQNVALLQRNRMPSAVEPRFVDQLHRLVDKLGYTIPRSAGELASALQGAPFKQFVVDHLATGAEMPVADFMLAADWTADVDKMTVEDFRAVNESIESILHNGRLAKKIRVGQETRDFVQTVAEGVNQVADVEPRVINRDPGALGKLVAGLKLHEWDAMMLKMEQMLRWMDKRDKFGVFTQAGFRRLTEAKHLKNDLLKEIGQDIKALPKAEGVDKQIDMANADGSPKYASIVDWQNGEPMPLQKRHVLMVALHSGNESNFGKLTSKYEYNGKEYQWTPGDVGRLLEDNMTKGDWEHVQGWWDLFEKYWPRVEALSRRMSGLAPDKIEAREITNKHGTWRGGYVPVGADLLWPKLKQVDRGVFNAERYFNAVPPKRYTIPRTEAAYPVSLAFDNLTHTLNQMAHDLAFREPLHDAAKFLDHPDIRGAIQRVMGPEYLAQVRPWLEFQAQSKLMGDEAVGSMDALARTARQRIVTVQMLYRAATMIKHGAAAAMYSIGEAGLRDVVAESVRLWATPRGLERVRQIFEESGEIRHRLHDMDRDIGEMQDRALGESGFKASFYHWGGMGTAALDIGTAIPVYEVAFKKQLLKDPSKYQDAIYAGEAAVRDAHGSAGITDQAAILRAGPMYKLFTIAYGTFNHNYNRIRDIGRLYQESARDVGRGDTAQAWEKFKTASWRSLWYVFVTAFVEELIAPIPDDEAKGKKMGVLHWGGRALFSQLSRTVPVVSEVVRAWLHKGAPEEQTPMGQIATSVFGAAKAAVDGDFTKKMAIRKTAEGIGYLVPLPGAGQVGATAQYWEDVKMRRQTAETWPRFVRGTLFGKSHPERK